MKGTEDYVVPIAPAPLQIPTPARLQGKISKGMMSDVSAELCTGTE